MLGPTLVHELPVEREFCTGLDFTGGEEKTKHHKSIKALLQKNQLQVLKKTLVVQLLPLFLFQVTTTVVKEKVHVL